MFSHLIPRAFFGPLPYLRSFCNSTQISEKLLRERCRECLELLVDSTEKAAVSIERELGCTNYEILPGGKMRLYEYLDAPAKVTHVLASNGVEISGVNNQGSNLEEYFLSLIGEEGGQDA